MTKEEIKEQVDRVEIIYKHYLEQLLELEKKRDEIIFDFSEVLRGKTFEGVK
ncbi:MAG: hypothetical protein AAB642_00950 [Patescibacteria group bacterium]